MKLVFVSYHSIHLEVLKVTAKVSFGRVSFSVEIQNVGLHKYEAGVLNFQRNL
jgi:hypothetical protein